VVLQVTEELDAWRVYDAARALSEFVDGLSNWYVRRSRDRFWGEGPDTQAALGTLHGVLVTLSKLMAPFLPFMAEAMFQRLAQSEPSVHMAAWPVLTGEQAAALSAKVSASAQLRADMALVRELASLGRGAREKVGVRVRQPLRAAEVVLARARSTDALAELLPLLKDELNVREISFSSDADRFVSFRVKPNLPRLGKRLGKDMKSFQGALQALDPSALRSALLGAGRAEIELPSGTLAVDAEDILVEVLPRAGFQAAGSANAVLALHANLDDDLREEGLAREVLNRIQTGRKELGLGYTERIHLELRGSEALIRAARRFEAHICHESLSLSLSAVVDEAAPERVDEQAFGLQLRRARA
jgi:isoleucyl-tRNA synthetase